MIDETIRQLDQLLQDDRAAVSRSLATLRASASRLGDPFLPDDELASQGDGRRARREVTAPAMPFVPLPSRTTHGGRWGPVVAAKLRAEALGRR